MKQWDILAVNDSQLAENKTETVLEEALKEGWEPFHVTENPETSMPSRFWLKREISFGGGER